MSYIYILNIQISYNIYNIYMEGGKLKLEDKKKALKQLQPTKEEAIKDLEKINDLTCDKLNTNSIIGKKFIDFFTLMERLETKGRSGKSFFDLWENRSEMYKKKYYKKLMKYKMERGSVNDVKIYKSIVNLYFGSVSIFKPSIAMDVYCRFNPTSILDMTMGWGGRLLGACALNIPKYTGIDLNVSLKKPYEEMVEVLKEYTTTKINLMFKDALKVDYNKLDYDLVLTSPPYYNIEIYTGTEKMSEEEWNETFYKPLFNKTWDGLKVGGHYCLNVPIKVYDDILIPLLGKADILIPMSISKRSPTTTYKEYIYVWKKTNKLVGSAIRTDKLQILTQSSYKKNKDIKDLSNHILDRQLSTKEAKVWYNPKKNQVYVANRGTNKTAKDWTNNLIATTGLYKNTQRYNNAKDLQLKVKTKYPNSKITNLGHSQSAFITKQLNEEGLTDEVINTNPATLPSDRKTKDNEYTLRSKGDLVSIFHKNDKNTTEIDNKTSNPILEHKTDIINRIPKQLIGTGMFIMN